MLFKIIESFGNEPEIKWSEKSLQEIEEDCFRDCENIYLIQSIKEHNKTERIGHEVIKIPSSILKLNYMLLNGILAEDYNIALSHSNIVSKTFSCNFKDAILNSINGTVLIPKYTSCNYRDFLMKDSIYFEASYDYETPKVERELVVWNKNFIGETRLFDHNYQYKKYCELYIADGIIATDYYKLEGKFIGYCMSDYSGEENETLKFLFDPNKKVDVKCL